MRQIKEDFQLMVVDIAQAVILGIHFIRLQLPALVAGKSVQALDAQLLPGRGQFAAVAVVIVGQMTRDDIDPVPLPGPGQQIMQGPHQRIMVIAPFRHFCATAEVVGRERLLLVQIDDHIIASHVFLLSYVLVATECRWAFTPLR
ncbi:MAG TPA: hypothetical protein H9774_05515 [Candidatus Desulfovibrio gallistercoris]|nr:hypothetical protein [Candidatus Desulfovibrio gallistercoris]